MNKLFAFYDKQLEKYSSHTDIDEMIDYLKDEDSSLTTDLSLDEKIAGIERNGYEVTQLDTNKIGCLINFVRNEMPSSLQKTVNLEDILNYASNQTVL